MNRLALLFTLSILIVSVSSISAQVSGDFLTEGDVPPNLIAKHFSNYQNSSTGKWYKDGSEFYISFVNQGRPYIAKYNKSGRLLMESVETESFTPQQIEKHLDFKFGKYKVLEVRTVKDLANDMEFYQVQVKSKSSGLVTEWYDRSLEPTDGMGTLAKN